jgi:hypothetical protein
MASGQCLTGDNSTLRMRLSRIRMDPESFGPIAMISVQSNFIGLLQWLQVASKIITEALHCHSVMHVSHATGRE